MILIRSSFFVIAASSVLGCGAKYDPFVASPQEIYATHQTLLLAPVELNHALADIPDSIGNYAVAMVEDRLRQTGFTIIPTHRFVAIWQPIVDELGGLYDPFTGQLDPEKHRVAIDLLAAQAAERHGADGILYSRLTVVPGAKDGETILTSVPVWSTDDSGKETVTYEFQAQTLPNGCQRVLALRVALHDLGGNERYVNWADVDKRDDKSVTTERLLAKDRKRVRQAVERALGPLIDNLPPVEPVREN